MVKRRRSLGHSFSDEVAKVTVKTGHFKNAQSAEWVDLLLPNFQPEKEHKTEENNWRIIFFLLVCLVSFFIIFLRLFHLQIVRGGENRSLADGNRIQVKTIHAPRGVIYDRNGKILAANSPAFRLTDPKANGHKVRLVTREEALEWEVKKDPRILNLEVDNVRNYPMGEKFAHVVGFLGEISESQLKDKELKGYRQG
ncbi:MAG: hypothetical protein NUV73_03085, partial [Candidatus Daviesbacteria bacterium]|nr:hypothetical protein [Candidatus Daviesbacteria bacterium]